MKNQTVVAADIDMKIAREFCNFLYEVPKNEAFTLWNLQGALRFVNRGIPSQQKYVDYLRIAIEAGWIEAVGKEDTYRRIRYARSGHGRAELQVLKERFRFAAEGLEWLD
jgi:hypothetical protein